MSPGLGSKLIDLHRFKFQTLQAGSHWAARVSHTVASAFKVTSPDVEGEKAGCR